MKKDSKTWLIYLFVLIFIVTFCVDLFCGNVCLSITDIHNFILGKEDLNTQILEVIRIPRVVKAIIAGSCLALSGMFLQTITKNPIVEPYFTGVSSGAGLALVLCILLNLSPSFYSVFGFIGAFVVSIVVIMITGINNFSLVKLILVGLSINIFSGSVISTLIIFNGDKAHALMMILTGNVNSSTGILKPLIALFIIGMIISVFMVPKLNFMLLDGMIIKALTKKADFYFVFIVILSAFIASLSVCAAGILGFVGIIIPHLSKLIIGENFKLLFIINILLGSSILLLCDFIARNVIYPSEIPLGVVVAIIGAPIFLVFLVFRGREFYA